MTNPIAHVVTDAYADLEQNQPSAFVSFANILVVVLIAC